MIKYITLGTLLLVAALVSFIFTSENREIIKLRAGLSNSEYKYYGKDIKYSVKNDLMNEFRNRLDIKEKKIVVVGDMMWQKEPYSTKATRVLWKKANSYCNKLTLDNFNDWRVPTSSELAQYCRSDCKVDFDKSIIFWSSTPSEKRNYEYEGVSFNGQTYSLRGNGGYAICVREL